MLGSPPENVQSLTDHAPQPLQECTDVSQLDAGLTPPENIQSPTDCVPSKHIRCGPSLLEKDYSLQPLPTPDRRMFFWQMKRATLQSIPAANEDPRPICLQSIEDDSYVFIPFGPDEQIQFRNFLDGWYAKETSCQFDALKEALGA